MGELVNLRGCSPIATGNVSVEMFKENGKWRIKVGVFGKPDMYEMRAGANATLEPERFITAASLKDAVGRLAAKLAKNVEKRTQGKFDACIDETEAYKFAVEMFEDCLLQLRFEGKA